MRTANPIIRPVFIVFDDHIPRPDHRVAGITRSPGKTIIHMQIGSDVLDVARDVNNLVEGDDEYLGWAIPYLGDNRITLARFRASPTAPNIPGVILGWPIRPSYIPYKLRAPGVNYN